MRIQAGCEWGVPLLPPPVTVQYAARALESAATAVDSTAQRQPLTAQLQKLTVLRHADPCRRIVAGGVLPECARPCLRPFGSLTGLVVNRSGR